MTSSISNTGAGISRTTLLLSSADLLSSLRRTQNELFRLQGMITSGKQVSRPSDAPERTSAILQLHEQLAARQQHERNLSHATSVLNATDQALADATDIMREASGIAFSQIGILSSADTRANQAVVIDDQIRALMEIFNRRIAGVSLFTGAASGGESGEAFVDFLGGIRYLGTTSNLANDTGFSDPLGFNANGANALAALSGRVKSRVDLEPQAVATTRLNDVEGAQGQGIRRGTIVVNIDGTEVSVDLTTADTLGDVVTRVNSAIASVDPAAGELAASGQGLTLLAGAGHTLTIEDLGPGQTAKDLGIEMTASDQTVAGQALGVRLTELTRLEDLGVTIDLVGGLTIVHGVQEKVADFSEATTIQDLINAVNRLNLGTRLIINEDHSGLDLLSEVSGLEVSVSENGDGTTAGDLGLRTFGLQTRLADFNHRLGVDVQQGEDDFQIQLHDGRSVSVNLDGVLTVADLLDAVVAAATDAGFVVGDIGEGASDFNIGLAPSGNGFALEDNTAGDADFRVLQLGTSLAATDLGIHVNAGDGSNIDGEDAAKVRVESAFTHLMNLRDALRKDDSRGIRLASSNLERDLNALIRSRGEVATRAQKAQKQQERSMELGLLEQSLLSDLQDADLIEVISRFQQLQLQLEMSLSIGSQRLQMSLLDFLR